MQGQRASTVTSKNAEWVERTMRDSDQNLGLILQRIFFFLTVTWNLSLRCQCSRLYFIEQVRAHLCLSFKEVIEKGGISKLWTVMFLLMWPAGSLGPGLCIFHGLRKRERSLHLHHGDTLSLKDRNLIISEVSFIRCVILVNIMTWILSSLIVFVCLD